MPLPGCTKKKCDRPKAADIRGKEIEPEFLLTTNISSQIINIVRIYILTLVEGYDCFVVGTIL